MAVLTKTDPEPEEAPKKPKGLEEGKTYIVQLGAWSHSENPFYQITVQAFSPSGKLVNLKFYDRYEWYPISRVIIIEALED